MVEVYGAIGDRESESKSAGPCISGPIDAIKCVEQIRQRLLRHAGATIAYNYSNFRPALLNGNIDGLSSRRESDSVPQDVLTRTREQISITMNCSR